MSYSRLIFTIFSAVGGILVFAIWSNSHAYAQQSSSPILSASSPPSTASLPSTTISPELKAKMCDPSNPALCLHRYTLDQICSRQNEALVNLAKLKSYGLTEDRILQLNNFLENNGYIDMRSNS
jgi:hypothetical protein